MTQSSLVPRRELPLIAQALGQYGRCHIHGVPGAGKRTTLAYLASLAESRSLLFAHRAMTPLADHRASTMLASDFFPGLAGDLGVAPTLSDDERAALHDNAGAAFWSILTRIATDATAADPADRPSQLFIELNDDLLFDDGFAPDFLKGYFARGAGQQTTLVTIATFSLEQLMRRRKLATASAGGEVGLSAFEVGDLGQRTVDFEALKTWFISRRDVAEEVASHVLDRVLGSSGGHPALTFRMLAAFAGALAEGKAARAALDAASLTVRDDTSWVMRNLAPHLRRKHERAGLAEIVRDAARVYVDKLLREPDGVKVEADTIDPALLSLGLFRARSDGNQLELTAASDVLHAVLRQADLDSQLLPALEHFAGKLRLAEEEGQREADPKLHDVHETVRQHICDTPLGKALKIELLDALSRVVLKDHFYNLVIEYDLVVEDSKRVRQRDDLKVFAGLGELGMSLWDREINLLRSLSALGHSALPQIHEGGTIRGGVQPAGGFEQIAFLRVRQQGGTLDPVARARLRAKPEVALSEACLLLEALVKLHELGVSHRRILPRHVLVEERGDDSLRLSLTGFEFAALIQSLVSSTGREAMGQLDRSMPGGLFNLDELIFFAPEVQPAFAEGHYIQQIDTLGMWPHSDTFSLSMLFAHMLFAEPDRAYLDDLGRAPAVDRQDAFATFLDRYRAQIKAVAGPVASDGEADDEEIERRRVLERLKTLVLEGLSWKLEHRRLPEDMLELFRSYLLPYEEAVRSRRAKFYVTYDRELMATMLPANGAFRVEANQRETESLVRDFLSSQLLSAERMIYVKQGAPPPKSGYGTGFHEYAKYVIVCPTVLIYTSLYRRYDAQGRWREDPYILRLAYAGQRQDFEAVPWQEEVKVEFPARMFELVTTDDEIVRVGLAGRRVQSWVPILERLAQDERRGDAQVAFDAMTFLADIEEHRIRVREFPVNVLKLGNQLHFRLDEEKFLKKISGENHQNLIYAGRRNPKIFFRERIAEWQDEDGEGDRSRSIRFHAQGSRRGTPLVFERVSDGVLIAKADKAILSGSGHLSYSDSGMTLRQLEVQKKGIAAFFRSPGKFEQLNSPRPTMLVRRPVRPLWNGRTADAPPRVRGRTPDIIENMSNSDPFYALQGPPGTGKTTAVAWFIATELERDPSQRILVTSQSHAAVDTILERVRDVLAESALDVGNHHLLRIMPRHAETRVSEAIRERHADDQMVKNVTKDIKTKSQERLQEETDPVRQEAYKILIDATQEANDEFKRRISQNASVVFSTTAASYSAQVEFRKSQSEFDIAIVDEASKAWASDLVLPLSRAARVVLIGDHKQLPPFDEDSVIRLFDRASEPRFHHAFPTIATNLDKMKAWTNPFRRLFEMRENEEGAFAFGGVRVVDFLDTQYRSVPEIGQLVSDMFYQGSVKTDPDMKPGQDAISWIDTSRLEQALYREERDRGWRLRNVGEAKLVRSIIEQNDTVDLQGGRVLAHEATMVLSPYRHQVAELRTELRAVAYKLGAEQGGLDRIVRTIDAAQGSEATRVIVSLVRSAGPLELPRDKTDPEEWVTLLNARFGFLRNPERINVMLSRARQKLVIVGDYEHFAGFEVLLDGWAMSHRDENTRRQIRERHSFWSELLRRFRGNAANRIDAASLLEDRR